MKYDIRKLIKKKNIVQYVSYGLAIFALILVIVSIVLTKPKKFFYENTGAGDYSVAEDGFEEDVNNPSSVQVKTFIKNGNEEINELISNYYNALRTGDDVELSKCTDNVEAIDPVKRKISVEFIEYYMAINSYSIQGLLDSTYIVVVEYSVKYKDIQTITSYLDYFYICKNTSGNLYISNEPVSEEVAAYNALMYETNSIVALVNTIAKKYDDALRNDAKLAQFIAGIQQEYMKPD